MTPAGALVLPVHQQKYILNIKFLYVRVYTFVAHVQETSGAVPLQSHSFHINSTFLLLP